MGNQIEKTPRRLSTIAWIMSRPEGKQFLSACLFVIMILSYVIVRQEIRYENNVERWQTREIEFQVQLKESKQETIDFLKKSNETTSKMRDSLYILGIRQAEIETRINKRRR